MKYPFWYPRYLNNGGISICVWCIHLYYQYINIYMSDVYIMAAKDSPFPGGCCCEVMFGGMCYFQIIKKITGNLFFIGSTLQKCLPKFCDSVLRSVGTAIEASV